MAKDKLIQVRVTLIEEAVIKRAAREAGVSVADYCRSRLLGAETGKESQIEPISEPEPIEPVRLPYAKPRATQPASQMPDNQDDNQGNTDFDWGS